MQLPLVQSWITALKIKVTSRTSSIILSIFLCTRSHNCERSSSKVECSWQNGRKTCSWQCSKSSCTHNCTTLSYWVHLCLSWATELFYFLEIASFFLSFFFVQLYCPIGISPMGNSDRFPQEKPAATVTLPNLWCMLDVLVSLQSAKLWHGPQDL